MDKEDTLKRLIIEAIISSPGTRKKIEVLKNGSLGKILQCYKETVDEFRPEKTEFDKYVRENFMLNDIVSRPQRTRATLVSWIKNEIWNTIAKKTGKVPDQYEFEIAFQQILD